MSDREQIARALSEALADTLGIAITLPQALRVLDAAKALYDDRALLRQSVDVDAGELVIDVRDR